MSETTLSGVTQELGDGVSTQPNVLSKRLNKILETRLDTDKVLTHFKPLIFLKSSLAFFRSHTSFLFCRKH